MTSEEKRLITLLFDFVLYISEMQDPALDTLICDEIGWDNMELVETKLLTVKVCND